MPPSPSDTPSAAAITREDVARLAHLARIDLTDVELNHLAPQLAVIVESVAVVSTVAADDIPPSSHAMPMQNVMRAVALRPGLTAEEALAGAPEEEQQRFKVPRILGEEQ